jgi:hypothetical protein
VLLHIGTRELEMHHLRERRDFVPGGNIGTAGETTVIEIKRGEFRVIRVDGTEELIEEKPTIGKIYHALGVTCCDSVTLRFGNGREDTLVMMVDDTGAVGGKPVNPKATELYLTRCKPGTAWEIHGDVAIVNDEDFAMPLTDYAAHAERERRRDSSEIYGRN